MRILIYISLLLLAGQSAAQIAFHKVYSQGSFDFGYGIDQLQDSSFIVTGASGGFGSGSQAFLLKLNKFGDYEWSLGYGGLESEEGKRVIYQENSGYFIGGTTNSYGNGAYDLYLTKVDVNGIQEWEYTFGGAAWDRLHDMALTRDSGFILVGENSSNPTENSDGYIVRTDKNGNMLWELKMGDAGDDMLKTIKAYNDSSYVVGGHYFNADSSMTKGVLYKILDDGTILDTLYLGDNGNYSINDIEIAGGQIEAVGYVDGPLSIETDHYAWEIDLITHAIISEWGVYTDGADELECITSYDNDSRRYITYNFGGSGTFEGGPDASIGAYNEDLIYLGIAALISDNGLDQTSDAKRTSDGGAVVVGSTAGPGNGVSTVFVTKIGPGEVYPSTTNPIVYNLVELPTLSDEILQISPNPFEHSVLVEGISSKAELTIRNVLGEIVYSDRLNSTSTIDLSHIERGAYFVTILLEGDMYLKKLIKH